METLVHVVSTSVGIFVALAVWFGIQGYVRRRSGCRRDRDVLEFMAHGCAGCKGGEACHSKQGEEKHQ